MKIIKIKTAKFVYNPTIDVNTLEFEEAIVTAEWVNSIPHHNFLVLVCMNEYGLFMKPIKPYEMSEFEEMFNLHGHCSDYDENKVIKVENIKNGISILDN